MTYRGDEAILKNHKIAFFCSQKCPAEVILKSFDWAIEQRNKGNCIITGAHSPVEKDVFHFLLKGKQPLILVLGRKMLKDLDPLLQTALDRNRLLIIASFFECQERLSKISSSKRNEFIANIADEIVVAHATQGGKLDLMLKSQNCKCVSFLKRNEESGN